MGQRDSRPAPQPSPPPVGRPGRTQRWVRDSSGHGQLVPGEAGRGAPGLALGTTRIQPRTQDTRLPRAQALGHQTLLEVLSSPPTPGSGSAPDVPGNSGSHGSSSAGVAAWGHMRFLVTQSQRLENSRGCASVRLLGLEDREGGREGSRRALLRVKLFKHREKSPLGWCRAGGGVRRGTRRWGGAPGASWNYQETRDIKDRRGPRAGTSRFSAHPRWGRGWVKGPGQREGGSLLPRGKWLLSPNSPGSTLSKVPPRRGAPTSRPQTQTQEQPLCSPLGQGLPPPHSQEKRRASSPSPLPHRRGRAGVAEDKDGLF